MSMDALYDIRDKFCDELEEIAQEMKKKGDLKPGDVETIHKLTDTVKNIDKIGMIEGENYSGDYMGNHGGDWEARGSYRDGSSYANRRGTHYVRGHYSRDNRNRGRDGRYSRDSAKDEMIDKLEDMMDMAENEKQRSIINRCISSLENV